MSDDAKPVIDEVPSNPAEAVKTEESVEVKPDAKPDAKPEAADEAANVESTEDVKAEQNEAANGTTEAVKSEEPVDEKPDAKPDAKPEAADEAANVEFTEDVKAKEKEAANGAAEAVKTEESSDVKSEEKATNGTAEDDKETNSRFKDERNNKFGDKRNGDGKFQKNWRPRHDEFADLPETDDPTEIRAQVEFYFSSQNLCTDRHLFLELDGPKNRPVPIKHICQFKRMRRFKPYSAIVEALRDSEDLVVVDDGDFSGTGNEAVKRKEPIAVPKREKDDKYPPDAEELYERLFKSSVNNLDASIYVKGFGEEEQAGQIALEQFFKPYGSVMVRKRRADDKSWKGSIFVEFESEESQQQFLALDPKPKYNGNELTVMSKKEYSEMKCKEKGITPAWLRNEEYQTARGGYRGGRGRGRDRGGRGGRGRGGRYNDRSDRSNYRDNRDRRDHRDRRGRDRSRSRSPPRRRDRDGSRSSEESKDWNGRRDRFQKSRDFKGDKRGNQQEDRKPLETNAYGVPVVKDTRTEVEKAKSKRKAEDSERGDSPKKPKIEIKEDE